MLSKNKRGYFFSLDALVALILILAVVLFIRPSSNEIIQEIDLQQDLLGVLSDVQIGELNNTDARNLISSGNITDLNQSVLEQLGEFYALSSSNAGLLASSILSDLNLDENVGLYFNNQPIANSNTSSLNDADNIWTSRQIISGISNMSGGAKGYSSTAFLSSENRARYFYLGGYVGDGNITLALGANVESVKIEAVFSGNFNLSVNGNSPVGYIPTPNVPYNFTLSSGFVSGENYLYFTAFENLYLAGGFVRVVYNGSVPSGSTGVYNFPGVEGFINLYDSFYIPGTLNSMEIFLNYSSDYNIFLSVGNQTVYSGNGTNEVTLDDSDLSFLGYSTMTDKTIPFRLGLENVSYVLNLSKDADVFSVTDLSGSMDDDLSCSVGGSCCDYGGCINDSTCYNCGGWWVGGNCYFSDSCDESQTICEDQCGGTMTGKIISAIDSNKIFINAVLNDSDNRVGLIGYRSGFSTNDYHALSNNNVSLIAEVESWAASGGTCICCGINEGVNRLDAQSDPNNFRSLVVLTDGFATVSCSQQGTTIDYNGHTGADDHGDDAVQAACDAYNDYGIRVYAVAFGANADTNTTEAIASCGQGSAYSGGVADLVSIYEEIAQEILNAAYYEQTVVGEGFSTVLDPSSYISVDYTKTIPYGLIIQAESGIFGSDLIGDFNLPFDAVPYEAQVVSYSGSRWTSLVEAYDNSSGIWEDVFDLSDYGSEYTELGDPFVVNIPQDKLRQGNNSVRVSLGLSAVNLTGGSEYNKVIYSVFKNISGFSTIVSSAEGCIWTIEFEDDSVSTMNIPSDYNGVVTCSYTSSSFSYNVNDAIDVAIYNLLSDMDLNSNGKIETKFTENDLTITSGDVEGIPFVWETEVQARIWR